MESQETSNGKILRQKNKAGSVTLSDFKPCNKAILYKQIWYWHISRHIDQWNSTDTSEINPCIQGQLIFNKVNKYIQQENRQPL